MAPPLRERVRAFFDAEPGNEYFDLQPIRDAYRRVSTRVTA